MLSHDNMTWFWTVNNTLQAKIQGPTQGAQEPIHQISYLPLSHITAQMSDFMRPLIFSRPVLLTFAPPEALSNAKQMLATLRETQPTEFVAVPRVYEKFKEVIEMRMRESSF